MLMKLKLLMIVLLITISTYSKENYPKQIVLNNDTLIAITKNQLKETNKKFIVLNWYQDKDSINNKIINNQSTIITKDSLVKINMNEKIKLLDENFSIMNEKNSNTEKKLNKSIKISKLKSYGIIIESLLIGILLIVW